MHGTSRTGTLGKPHRRSISPHASDTHFRRLLLTALICCCVSHRLVFTDEEGIDAIGNLLFGFLAADLMQFSGQRGVHAEARGDARTVCPRERLEAHMGCRAAATVQLLHARPDSRELGRTWESRLAAVSYTHLTLPTILRV